MRAYITGEMWGNIPEEDLIQDVLYPPHLTEENVRCIRFTCRYRLVWDECLYVRPQHHIEVLIREMYEGVRGIYRMTGIMKVANKITELTKRLHGEGKLFTREEAIAAGGKWFALQALPEYRWNEANKLIEEILKRETEAYRLQQQLNRFNEESLLCSTFISVPPPGHDIVTMSEATIPIPVNEINLTLNINESTDRRSDHS